ncbi:MAG: ribosomal protein L13e [Candidatus Thorarchaeota archaeon]|nr:ribosomal protein L13e [Candidatus Thorarchaeota archaeon]
MSFDIIAEPTVKSPRDGRPKKGRGFSSDEAAQAGLTIDEARQMGLILDIRRRTAHPENVVALKQYMKDLEELVSALAKDVEPTKAKAAAAVDDLASLRAVKVTEVPLLVKAGIKSFEDLAYCDISKVANKTGIDEDRITAMVKAALRKV